MREKKMMIAMLVAISIVAFSIFLIVLSNPLRWPEKNIRAKMLKLTPIGTKIDDVVNIISDNKWEMDPIRNYGYYYDGAPSRIYSTNDDRVIGVKSLDVYIGEYRTIFVTDVTVFYGFDKDSKLIDIAVMKEKDTW